MAAESHIVSGGGHRSQVFSKPVPASPTTSGVSFGGKGEVQNIVPVLQGLGSSQEEQQ